MCLAELPKSLKHDDRHECLYKACQATITHEGLFTETGVHEQSENDCEMKTVKVKV